MQAIYLMLYKRQTAQLNW